MCVFGVLGLFCFIFNTRENFRNVVYDTLYLILIPFFLVL